MSSSLEPPAEDSYKGKKKSVRKAPESRISYSSQDDSAWGGLDILYVDINHTILTYVC